MYLAPSLLLSLPVSLSPSPQMISIICSPDSCMDGFEHVWLLCHPSLLSPSACWVASKHRADGHLSRGKALGLHRARTTERILSRGAFHDLNNNLEYTENFLSLCVGMAAYACTHTKRDLKHLVYLKCVYFKCLHSRL